MFIDVNTIASLVETSKTSNNNIVTILSTLLISLGFAAIHIWSKPLHKFLYRSEYLAASFSGGMAISYVFINLLPELETAEELIGHSIHFVVLIGFLIFYSLQSLVWKTNNEQQSKYLFIFGVELFFYCLYNGLLIYTIPEKANSLISSNFPYLIAIGFHLLHNNHQLAKKYGKLFGWGRYFLVGTITIAFCLDIVAKPANQLISDFLIAFLAGSIMFNVFYEELPSPKISRLHWFLAGVIVYLLLRSSSLMFT